MILLFYTVVFAAGPTRKILSLTRFDHAILFSELAFISTWLSNATFTDNGFTTRLLTSQHPCGGTPAAINDVSLNLPDETVNSDLINFSVNYCFLQNAIGATAANVLFPNAGGTPLSLSSLTFGFWTTFAYVICPSSGRSGIIAPGTGGYYFKNKLGFILKDSDSY